jgi:hypothetical protein
MPTNINKRMIAMIKERILSAIWAKASRKRSMLSALSYRFGCARKGCTTWQFLLVVSVILNVTHNPV